MLFTLNAAWAVSAWENGVALDVSPRLPSAVNLSARGAILEARWAPGALTAQPDTT